ncbi:hypothetical protein ACWCXH_07495 [Kitasatospora sp. NPDC001660]
MRVRQPRGADRAGGATVRPAPVDFFALDDAGVRSTSAYPTTPVGDPVDIAAAVAASLDRAPLPSS